MLNPEAASPTACPEPPSARHLGSLPLVHWDQGPPTRDPSGPLTSAWTLHPAQLLLTGHPYHRYLNGCEQPKSPKLRGSRASPAQSVLGNVELSPRWSSRRQSKVAEGARRGRRETGGGGVLGAMGQLGRTGSEQNPSPPDCLRTCWGLRVCFPMKPI